MTPKLARFRQRALSWLLPLLPLGSSPAEAPRRRADAGLTSALGWGAESDARLGFNLVLRCLFRGRAPELAVDEATAFSWA
jgi:hypothetical protein